jgi:beta-galactosidase/beta-glucuronidase
MPAMPTSRPARQHDWLVVMTALTFTQVGALFAQADDRIAPLPPGVKAVWSVEKAARDVTPTRERISINGLWRWQPASAGATEPPTEGWGHFKVPGSWPGITDYMQHDAQTVFLHPRWKDAGLADLTSAWYLREITIPAGWKGRRIVLGAEYLNSLATVFVDGRRAGELRFPGGELDLTPLDLAAGTHELSMLVVALPLKGVMMSYTDSATAREVKGSVPRRGLCGDVFLMAMPARARIDGVRVETSVRRSQVTFDAALAGLDSGRLYTLRAAISREGRQLAQFDSPRLTTADLAGGHYRFTGDWKPDRFWDLHTPSHMETLSLSLHDGGDGTLDVFWDERFGFREFWIEGRDLFLNGSRIFLSAVPVDNAQVSAALAGYAAARESLERLRGFGINFVYTHNYGCEPGSHLGFAEILRAADDAGVLVAFSQPHFSHYEWKAPDADRDNGYRRHATFYTQAAGNHPSVVFYAMSHNATGYDEDMNPDRFGNAEASRDRWSLNNVKLAERAESIVRALDPSRIVYHHASGNLGVMHDTNFYPNFVPIQELSDWFETWSTTGVKPAFTCEYGAPFTWDWTMYRGWYKGQRSFGSARVPWEFCLAEWNAQFLGDRAYRITEMEKKNLRWEALQFREGKLWHRWDYPYEVGSKVFDDRHEVIGRYLTDNFRAFRTWGVSATSPWEHNHFWRPRTSVDRARKNPPVDWEDLQHPGFSADFIDRTYERMDLAFGRDDWEPTADGRALLRNNRPLLAYIAGKPGQFTSKDHNAQPGDRMSKQLVVLNNSRTPITCDVSWSLDLPTPVSGAARVTAPTGEQRRIPVEVSLPETLPRGRYALKARFAFDAGEVQDDDFALDVLPRPNTAPISSARLALYDPKGETSALLKSLEVAFEPVDADTDLAAFGLLVVGKGALTVEGPGPRIDRVRDGLHVLAFEQTSQALERRLGFRAVEYGLRQVHARVPDHPLLAGLTADHLHDWRGEATLVPPRLDYELRPMHGPTVRWCDLPVSRAWRCGNRGNVASVLIEKPARGDFLPIVDGGFGLQYSPLLEYREGRGRVLFCQLDVTARTEPDPAADTLVRNLLAYASSPAPFPPRRPVGYAGEPAGLAYLRLAGIHATSYEGSELGPEQVLVIGPGAGPVLDNRRQAIVGWLEAGGRLLAIGCDSGELAIVSSTVRTRQAEHIAAFFEPPSVASPLAGVGPADVHNRDPRDMPLVTGGADFLGDGVLALARDGHIVLCQIVPWQFEPEGPSNIMRTYRRAAFLVSRLLGNLGVASETPLIERFRTAAKAERRWESGFYLDQPEEWDDPYRFFRW